jgi:hypothetical protein
MMSDAKQPGLIPYLSVVAISRNDDHGGSGTRRMQMFVNALLYVRDGGSPDFEAVCGTKLSAQQVLKLASVLEVFDLGDCAAELIQQHADALAAVTGTTRLLDALVPEAAGRWLVIRNTASGGLDSEVSVRAIRVFRAAEENKPAPETAMDLVAARWGMAPDDAVNWATIPHVAAARRLLRRGARGIR